MNHPVTAYSRRFSRALPVVVEPEARQLGHDDLHLSIAASEAEFRIAHRLAHEAYVDAGYCDPSPDGRLVHYQEFDKLPETRVFLIRQGRTWVGTVSYTCESPRGLPIDDDFLPEIEGMQKQGRRVGVVWRLATLPGYRHSMQVANALLTACVRRKLEKAVDSSLMMTHERHSRFYRRCFAMEQVCQVAGVSKFSRIPVVLLRCDRERLPKRWWERAGAVGPIQ